jgi:OmpA-OmpF porin, OOP family
MRNIIPVYTSALFLLAGTATMAQKNEFSIYAGAGMQGLQYTNNLGSLSVKPGFQAGISFTHFLSSRWGIRSGLEIGYYHSRATLKEGTPFTSYEIDSEGQAFEYRVKAGGYTEDQKLYTVNIPLQIQFQTPAACKQQFYAAAGAKLGLPLSQRYASKAGDINTTGYYPHLNIEITDLPVHGFGKQAGWSGEGEYEFKPSVSLTAEAGMRFRLSGGRHLYAGAYLDYGLNDIRKTEGPAALLAYNPNGLAQSKATGLFNLNNVVSDTRLIAYGIKLGFVFGNSRSKTKTATVAPPPTVTMPPAEPVVVKKEEPVQQPVIAQAPVPEKVAPVEKPKDILSEAELAVFKTPLSFAKKGDTTLSAAVQAQADKIIAILQTHPAVTVEIQGHTCDAGSDAVNERIGLARANVTARYIESKGIAAARIQTTSKADHEPVVPNTSETNRQQNRRVVFIITGD